MFKSLTLEEFDAEHGNFAGTLAGERLRATVASHEALVAALKELVELVDRAGRDSRVINHYGKAVVDAKSLLAAVRGES